MIVIIAMYDSSQLFFKPIKQKSPRIIKECPERKSCSLKQVFNITYTHYCSTSIHKKLHNVKYNPSRIIQNKTGFRSKKEIDLRVKKKSLSAYEPMQLGIIHLKFLQKRKSKCSIHPRRIVTEVDQEKLVKDKTLYSQLSQQNFPLKATGLKISLKSKQTAEKARISTHRPMTCKFPQHRRMGSQMQRRLKTVQAKRGEDRGPWNESSILMQKGWQYQ